MGLEKTRANWINRASDKNAKWDKNGWSKRSKKSIQPEKATTTPKKMKENTNGMGAFNGGQIRYCISLYSWRQSESIWIKRNAFREREKNHFNTLTYTRFVQTFTTLHMLRILHSLWGCITPDSLKKKKKYISDKVQLLFKYSIATIWLYVYLVSIANGSSLCCVNYTTQAMAIR